MTGIPNTTPKQINSAVSLHSYTSDKQVVKNKIVLQQNLINLLESGEKKVYYANGSTTITSKQLVLLSSGNCLMTEKLSTDHYYRSTMFMFDNSVLAVFFIKYASVLDKLSIRVNKLKEPFIVLEKDEFIINYIASLKIMQQSYPASEQMVTLKFEELMLHLLEKYPQSVLSFHLKNQQEYSDFEIQRAVEQNITGNLTLEEFAFLCHTSVSTFKRRFVKLYKATPSQYFLQRKMELASSLLLQNENPGEVYYKVGYENHSSFSQSFKQVYGISPKQYQQQKMVVSQQLLNDQP